MLRGDPGKADLMTWALIDTEAEFALAISDALREKHFSILLAVRNLRDTLGHTKTNSKIPRFSNVLCLCPAKVVGVIAELAERLSSK